MRALYAIILPSLALGVTLNLAMAWMCAAWVEPSRGTTSLSIVPRSDGRFDATTCRASFGHKRVSRATLSSIGGYPDSGQILELEWDITGHEYSETRAGWPLPALACRNYSEVEIRDSGGATNLSKTGLVHIEHGIELKPWPVGGAVASWRALPCRPLWSGVIVNSLLLAVISSVCLFIPTTLRRRLRRRRGQCQHCGYPIGASPVCSECGAPICVQTGEPA